MGGGGVDFERKASFVLSICMMRKTSDGQISFRHSPLKIKLQRHYSTLGANQCHTYGHLRRLTVPLIVPHTFV